MNEYKKYLGKNNYSLENSLHKKALAIMENDHTDYISDLLATTIPENFDKYVSYISITKNPLKRVVKLLSNVYNKPARISTGIKEFDEDLIKKIPKYHLYMKEVNKYLNAFYDVLIRPIYDKDKKVYTLQILDPTKFDVELKNGIVEKITVYLEDDESIVYLKNGTFRKDKGSKVGKVQKGITSSFGVIWIRMIESSKEVWGIKDLTGLINATINIGVLETYYNYTAYLRSFRLTTLNSSDAEIPSKKIKISPNSVFPTPLNSIELASPLDEFFEGIQKKEVNIASTFGIGKNIYLASSEKDKKQEEFYSNELKSNWYDQVAIFRVYEKELIKVIAQYENYYNSKKYNLQTIQDNIFIDYIEPNYNLIELNMILKNLDQEIRLGRSSVVKSLLRYDPDIRSLEQAQKIMESNLEERMNNIIYMRSLNVKNDGGIDDNDIINTPEKNGSLGTVGLNKNEIEDKNGKNGQPILPPDLTK